MILRTNVGCVIWLLLPLWAVFGSDVLAESRAEDNPGVTERMGKTAKSVGNKIEQGLNKAAKKLEEKKVGEKIERKLRKAVTKAEEGFKKAGRKIDQKLR